MTIAIAFEDSPNGVKAAKVAGIFGRRSNGVTASLGLDGAESWSKSSQSSRSTSSSSGF